MPCFFARHYFSKRGRLIKLDNHPVASGLAGLDFSSLLHNTGSIDISVNSLFEWLKFGCDGDENHDNSPTSRATFGPYKGNQKKIYFREVYN